MWRSGRCGLHKRILHWRYLTERKGLSNRRECLRFRSYERRARPRTVPCVHWVAASAHLQHETGKGYGKDMDRDRRGSPLPVGASGLSAAHAGICMKAKRPQGVGRQCGRRRGSQASSRCLGRGGYPSSASRSSRRRIFPTLRSLLWQSHRTFGPSAGTAQQR